MTILLIILVAFAVVLFILQVIGQPVNQRWINIVILLALIVLTALEAGWF